MRRGRKLTTKKGSGELFSKENEKIKVPETITLDTQAKEPIKPVEIKPTEEKEIPKNIFQEMEKKDEEQIQLIESGVVVDESFYALTEVPDPENPEETKIVYGISFAGTMNLAREQKNLKVIGQPFPEHTTDTYNYTVTVEDTTRGVSTYGSSSESKFYKSKSGKTIFENGQPKINPFARIICLTKAQRNAFRKLLESERIENAFKSWYKKKYGGEANMNNIIIVSEYTKLDTFKVSSHSPG